MNLFQVNTFPPWTYVCPISAHWTPPPPPPPPTGHMQDGCKQLCLIEMFQSWLWKRTVTAPTLQKDFTHLLWEEMWPWVPTVLLSWHDQPTTKTPKSERTTSPTEHWVNFDGGGGGRGGITESEHNMCVSASVVVSASESLCAFMCKCICFQMIHVRLNS